MFKNSKKVYFHIIILANELAKNKSNVITHVIKAIYKLTKSFPPIT